MENAEDGFASSEFNDLQKVYSIWICPKHTKEKIKKDFFRRLMIQLKASKNY